MQTMRLALAILLIACARLPALAAENSADRLSLTGIVFSDTDRNGLPGEGEPGLANIAVSDGDHVAVSDANGRYALPANTNERSFVFVTVPAGYAHTAGFYRPIGTDTADISFGLRAAPETKEPEFSFVQITDIHIGYCLEGDERGPEADGEALARDLDQLNRIVPRPAFVVATGDLVDSGSRRRLYEIYSEACAAVSLPLYNVMGNHDKPIVHYEEFLGPACYSFDHGECHFVVLNSVGDTARERAWLEKDMAVQNPGKLPVGDPISIGYTSPAVKGAVVYVGGKGRDGHLYSLALENGTTLWDFPMGMGFMSSTPAVSGSSVYVGSPGRGLLALDAATGKELWNFTTGKAVFSVSPGTREENTVSSSPALCGGVVCFGADDGWFHALDAAMGASLWRYEIGVPAASSPAISGNACYVGALDGNIYAFLGY